MPKLKLTHVAQVEGDDKYYIRFTSSWDEAGKVAWLAFKTKLKQQRGFAQWDPKFTFHDGKIGAWSVSAFFLKRNKAEFSNYDEAMRESERHEDPIQAWIKQAMRERYRSLIPVPIQKALQTLELPFDKLPSQEELKKQYRAMAFHYHPDRTKDNGCKMKDVNIAKETVHNWLISSATK